MRIIDIKDMDSIMESVRPKPNNAVRQKVLSIISDVQKRKDKALKEYETKFSGTQIRSLQITPQTIKSAYSKVKKEQIDGIKLAKTRLEKSENAVRKNLLDVSVTSDGIVIKKTFSPIDIVGCYIPGGKAKYPSTIVMSVVPAKVAGVKKIIAVSPSNEKGEIDPLTLVAGDICGVDQFYRIGGAQAIAALAYGTETIPQVDKIVGPGGAFVTLAKSLLSEVVSIDMVAGPTELAIIADVTADAELVALDLISQAEHSPDTMCCLITNSPKLKDSVLKLLQKKIKTIKRSLIVKESLRKNGFITMCNTEQQMIDFANKLAPEHLEIITKKPQQLAKKIRSAGLTLIGKNTPSSASDYLLGSNHILPTNRFGRTRGSLGVLDYMKIQTQVESSESALKKISKYMKALTEAEGLPNHYEAVKGRLS
ncbi:MAG TPA: histidinol dehydrogenase [Candidatus Nitrosotalea sp.]|nr:histidinol dehydrogenase [Candidatus Nitrosotalea sp.]HEU5487598.1 histidinol dehydrogenase [Candidatus Nitrosotalea sp.]